ncbi:MAG: hypothetical protein P1U40_03100 [Coxiellaceae bacterium]|nr:hypothetical protein [Coxiellaceae bacterium]
MRTRFYQLCGGLFAVYKTVIYFNGQLESGAKIHLVSDDYKDLINSTRGVATLAVLGICNFFLLSTFANTYIKKSSRYMNGKESHVLPEAYATRAAAVGATTKVLTSSLSAGLSLSWLVEQGIACFHHLSANEELVTRIASIILINALTLPSALYVYYTIGFNEASSQQTPAPMHPAIKRLLQRIDGMMSRSAHAMVANTPSNTLYVIEGYHIVKFITRFALAKNIDTFSIPMGWAALITCINVAFIMAMEVSYNVKYRHELNKVASVVHQSASGDYTLMADENPGCSKRLMDMQQRFVEKHNRLINGTASLFVSFVMTAGAYMLVYAMAANKKQFDQGKIELGALGAAGTVGLLGAVVAVVANSSFLFEKYTATSALPVTAADAAESSPRLS